MYYLCLKIIEKMLLVIIFWPFVIIIPGIHSWIGPRNPHSCAEYKMITSTYFPVCYFTL